MRSDMVILKKKHERNKQKLKQYDTELKMTRQKVSTFKLKFRKLMDFISRKGGIDVINNLPNIGTGQPANGFLDNDKREI